MLFKSRNIHHVRHVSVIESYLPKFKFLNIFFYNCSYKVTVVGGVVHKNPLEKEVRNMMPYFLVSQFFFYILYMYVHSKFVLSRFTIILIIHSQSTVVMRTQSRVKHASKLRWYGIPPTIKIKYIYIYILFVTKTLTERVVQWFSALTIRSCKSLSSNPTGTFIIFYLSKSF